MKTALLLWLVVAILLPIPIDDFNRPHYPTTKDAPISQAFGNLGHVGIDIFVPVGTNVYAVMPGTVIERAEDSRVYGRYLMILHTDGYASLYAHLSKITVKLNDVVLGGQVIAKSGGDPYDFIDGDGWSSGTHLHFEVRTPEHINNNLYNIDPLKYLGFDNEE